MTIIVLLILAGVTIVTLLGDNGIIRKAQLAKEKTESAKLDEQQGLSDLEDKMDTVLNGDLPKVEDNVGTVISTTKNTDLEDNYGNKITVPAGFHIVSTSEDSTVVYNYSGDGVPAVQDGIVVADGDGNQFVWVPVGTINNKTSDTNGTTSTITLGRYSSFTKDSTTGLYTPVQTIDNYASTVTIADYFQEDTLENHKKENNIAIDIGEFLTKANAKGGYYLARYEASENETDNTKAASKSGQTVWTLITQSEAAIAAKKAYPVDGVNKDNYYSDLINSYAWDTAIIFIQTYSAGNSNYASVNKSTSFTTTGGNGDQVCNINDMSGNAYEWTTETSTSFDSFSVYPCTRRGGLYNTGNDFAYDYTCYRSYYETNDGSYLRSFRLVLYLK